MYSIVTGQPSTNEDVDDLVSRLRQAEEQVNDLRERLKTSSSNVEQYRTMVLSLEESLNKEKQVSSDRCFLEQNQKQSEGFFLGYSTVCRIVGGISKELQ